jgi:uncharacterized protein (DUF924 family)
MPFMFATNRAGYREMAQRAKAMLAEMQRMQTAMEDAREPGAIATAEEASGHLASALLALDDFARTVYR